MLTVRSLLIFIAALIATVSAGTNQEGLAFLKAKAAEEGVVTLDSGLLYKELRAGNGSTKKAKISTPCKVRWHR
jgi:FKBP-type peptidyl-prolyl cis-trans isomerase